jgi:hypothetical protein
MNNKIIFIAFLKLLKTFIEVDNDDMFKYLQLTHLYDKCRIKYSMNQFISNITNSVFLSIFKAA